MPFHVIAGTGPDGRSTVLSREERVLVLPADAGVDSDDSSIRAENSTPTKFAMMARTDAGVNFDRPKTGHVLPTAFGIGGTIFAEQRVDGACDMSMHRTDTIDYQYITGGEVELVLETGPVTLKPGDTVEVRGVLHGWRTKTNWSSIVFAIGIAPV